jgi:NAD(P)-dependent dehydrogenase (short-subunit alcohol dehydrogenase family)
VAVSSISSLRAGYAPLIEACLGRNEAEAIEAAKKMIGELEREPDAMPLEARIGLAIYGNAKQALQRWCRKVAPAPEWAGAGIALNVVALGFYDTPAAAYILNDPATRAGAAAMVPMRGAFPGRPEEAAALLAWCISAENSQMTGQTLFADGGFEAKALAA